MPVRQKQPTAIFQLKITLKETKPLIWRRVQTRADTTLEQLQHIIQIAMGWGGGHLHQFIVGETYYTHPEEAAELEAESTRSTKLNEVVAAAKDRFFYEYDFGDSWVHEIRVEKILPAEEGGRYPVCVAGARACPPEDCGGPWGYDELLKIRQNPKHPEYEERMEWLGEEFDPEAFDLEEVNQLLSPQRGRHK